MRQLLVIVLVLVGFLTLAGAASAISPAGGDCHQKQLQARADNLDLNKFSELYRRLVQAEVNKGNQPFVCVFLRNIAEKEGLATICVMTPDRLVYAVCHVLFESRTMKPLTLYVAGQGMLRGYTYRAWGESYGPVDKGIGEAHHNWLEKHEHMRYRRFLAPEMKD